MEITITVPASFVPYLRKSWGYANEQLASLWLQFEGVGVGVRARFPPPFCMPGHQQKR
jgi:hypothetical protein